MLCWNLDHFNSSFGDDVVQTIAKTVCDYDLIYLMEVSSPAKDPPLELLVKKIHELRESQKKKGVYKYKHTVMNKGFWGVAMYNSTIITFRKQLEIEWEKHSQPYRYPFVLQYAVKNSDGIDWNFTVSGVHLKSGKAIPKYNSLY